MLALLVALTCAPASAEGPHQGPVFPAGSRVGLVPPDGFAVNAAIHGFDDKANDAAFLIFEMPGPAFSQIEQSMTAAALKKQGMALEKREELPLADGKAVLVSGPQEAEHVKVRKWILIAALGQLTALVTVQVPETAKDLYPDKVIRAALSTLTSRATVPVEELLSLLPYRLSDLSGFRVVNVIGTSLALTDGVQDTLDAAKQPLVFVTVGAGGPESPSSRQNFSRNAVFEIPGFTDVKMVNSEMLRLNGQQISEILIDAKDVKTGSDLKAVQWIRFGASAYIKIVAIAPKDDWSQAFPRFRAVRDGIGPK